MSQHSAGIGRRAFDIVTLLALACLTAASAGAQRYALVHGRWFDGRSFVPRTVYVSDGIFVARRPSSIDSTIDLAGLFVVSPFGEAHNHNIEGARPARIKSYLDAGIFYVKDPCSFPEAKTESAGKLNVPTSVDAIFSLGCLTAPGGHPSGLVQRNIARGVFKPNDGDGRFFHAVVDSADLDRRWPGILAAKPDFIKTILVYSEEYDKRRADSSYFNWRGIDPALVPLVVRRAHAAGLRVSSHVESAADFHAALTAGVDEINHTPGFRPERDSIGAFNADLSRYVISGADARLAAKRKTIVVTTLGESIEYMHRGDSVGLDSAARARVLDLYKRNLSLLKRSGVHVVLGSDRYSSNTVSEALALRTLGVYNDVEILSMWSVGTPRAIFPARRIGCLTAGCEASLLALRGNPLVDFDNVQRIAVRMKQGTLLP